MGMMGCPVPSSDPCSLCNREERTLVCLVCGNEVPKSEIGECKVCGFVGLCSHCQIHEEHINSVDDGK